ncbi:MAG: sulfurtransferase TusA family protein [Phenylobacterium sp.]|nr:sulfurtransferase TusA family protein [Phenylobacterium sp.]
MTDSSEDFVIDARGHHCPVPTLRLRRALEGIHDQVVRLIADDPMARIDVPHFVREAGAELIETTETAGVLTFRVRRPQA